MEARAAPGRRGNEVRRDGDIAVIGAHELMRHALEGELFLTDPVHAVPSPVEESG
jgi:hypothetical protein